MTVVDVSALLWSAEVRLAVSALLAPVGLACILTTLRRQRGPLMPLALLALCYSVLQLAEAALLLQLHADSADSADSDFRATLGTVVGLLLLVFLPFWSSFAVCCLELHRANGMLYALYALAVFAALSEWVAGPLLDAGHHVFRSSLNATEALASLAHPAVQHDFAHLPVMRAGALSPSLFKLALLVLPALPAAVSAAEHIAVVRTFVIANTAAAFLASAFTAKAFLSLWGLLSSLFYLLLVVPQLLRS